MERARRQSAPRIRAGGFTLVEVLISSAIGAITLAGVIAVFLMFCRTGTGLAHYSDMERQSRSMLQRFGRDTRQASAAQWVSATTLALTVRGATVTYAYDVARGECTRQEQGSAAEVIARGVASFHFIAYNLSGSRLALDGSNSGAGAATRMVQVEMDLQRNRSASGAATAKAVSASYVLRNKSTS